MKCFRVKTALCWKFSWGIFALICYMLLPLYCYSRVQIFYHTARVYFQLASYVRLDLWLERYERVRMKILKPLCRRRKKKLKIQFICTLHGIVSLLFPLTMQKLCYFILSKWKFVSKLTFSRYSIRWKKKEKTRVSFKSMYRKRGFLRSTHENNFHLHLF